MSQRCYRESFDTDAGGWYGWASNALGFKALEVRNSCLVSRSPWWIDYNHAPPGAGYLHIVAALSTQGPFGEYHQEVAGRNRFAEAAYSTDLTNAEVTFRIRGELNLQGANLHLLVQASRNRTCAGWVLTGQPIEVCSEWTEPKVRLIPDTSLWTPLGSRQDRMDFYGFLPLKDVLSDVNVNVLLILFPLQIVPMGEPGGDPHRLRPEKDYPVWRSRLPEGYLEMDEIRIESGPEQETCNG